MNFLDVEAERFAAEIEVILCEEEKFERWLGEGKFQLPAVRRVVPSLVPAEYVKVQPMATVNAPIFNLRFNYDRL